MTPPDEPPVAGGEGDASFDYVGYDAPADGPPDASGSAAAKKRADPFADEDDYGDDETILIDGRAFRGSAPGEAPTPTPPPAAPSPSPTPPPAAPAPTPELPAPPPTAPPEVPGVPADTPPIAAGLRGLVTALRARRARGTQLTIAVLCGLLGFFAVVQVRLQAQDNTLSTARQSDLIRILDDLNDRSDRLESELRDLTDRRDELQFGTDKSQAALQEAELRRATLGILAGTLAAHGPGITLRITDPGRKVDAAVLLDTLQELRDAGAEAVQIGDVRIVASTDFLDAGAGKVRIDGRVLTSPYVFKVIGDPDTLDPALRIPGGVFAVLDERGATPTVDAKRTVVIDAVRPAPGPQYARPQQG